MLDNENKNLLADFLKYSDKQKIFDVIKKLLKGEEISKKDESSLGTIIENVGNVLSVPQSTKKEIEKIPTNSGDIETPSSNELSDFVAYKIPDRSVKAPTVPEWLRYKDLPPEGRASWEIKGNGNVKEQLLEDEIMKFIDETISPMNQEELRDYKSKLEKSADDLSIDGEVKRYTLEAIKKINALLG